MTKIMWGIIDSKKIYLSVEITQSNPPLQLGQLIMYYTPKKLLPFAFFLTYQALKNLEGIVSRKNH